jgi:hypothetical protein
MVRVSTFMDQQKQYCEHGYTTKIDLQIQCNPHQNLNDILNKNRKST